MTSKFKQFQKDQLKKSLFKIDYDINKLLTYACETERDDIALKIINNEDLDYIISFLTNTKDSKFSLLELINTNPNNNSALIYACMHKMNNVAL